MTESRSQGAGYRPGALPVTLVGGDGLVLLQGQRDVVQAVEKTVLDLRVDLEPSAPSRPAHLLGGQVDLGLPRLGDRPALIARQLDREQADLRAVGAEDVGEAGGDDRLKPVVLERPRRVLAAGATAEVAAGHEDGVLRQIPVGLLGPVVEEELPKAGALDPLEELLGDDLIGVDVVAAEHADASGDGLDRLHALTSSHSRMSTKCPSMAAAAAICGDTRCDRAPRP